MSVIVFGGSKFSLVSLTSQNTEAESETFHITSIFVPSFSSKTCSNFQDKTSALIPNALLSAFAALPPEEKYGKNRLKAKAWDESLRPTSAGF
jgi:hypothetical protein